MTVTSRLAAVAVSATLLAGCSTDRAGGSGDDADDADPGGPASGAAAAEASAEPSPTSSVPPATGRPVDNSVLTLRLPEGFRHHLDVFGGALYRAEDETRIGITAHRDTGAQEPLDEAVTMFLEHSSFDAKTRRRPDIEVDGHQMARFSGRRSSGFRVEVLVTDRHGSLVVLEFASLARDMGLDQLRRSVLATLEWK